MAAFLGRVRDAPSAVVLEGEAGIGKSTLWLERVSLARARGISVVSSRPAEAEQALVYVGLGDLLDDVLDEVLPALAPPRRRALGVAMLRDDASGAPSTAVPWGSLFAMCSRGSARTRRSCSQSMTCSGSMRPPRPPLPSPCAGSRQAVFWCCSLGARRRAAHVRAGGCAPTSTGPAGARGPLSVGALHRLLRHRLGTSFARQTLLATPWKTSGRGRRSDRPSSTRAMTCTSYATTPRSWTTCTWSRSSRRASLGASTKTIPTPASAPTENQAGPRGATSGRPRTRPLVVHPPRRSRSSPAPEPQPRRPSRHDGARQRHPR